MTRLLFEWVVTASLLILAVLALRALLGKRISAGLKYALWAVVLVRLLVPLQFFSLPVPAAPELEREPAVPSVSAVPDATFPVLQGEPVGTPAITAPAPSGVAANYNTLMEPDAVTLDVVQVGTVLGWLWLAGALVMTAALLISNLTFALRLRRVRTPLEGANCPLPVYVTDGLPSPCLFGLFRPAVYVTAETAQDPAMLRHILAHEYTHFRHGDHVWNVLRSAALAVHWWNPLVWLAVVLSRRDCELACDEGALKRLGEVERIAYGRTLLALITVKPRPGDLLRCATTMTGGQKSVFDRVTRIAKAPKRWLWAAVAAVIAASLACVCAFGQAEGTPDPDPWDPSSVTANLTFSLETDSDGDPYVRMDGFVDGVELTRGAFWDPDWWHGDYCEAELTLMYPPFTDGIEGHIEAAWESKSGSEISISTQPTALFSSYMPAGWWVFTVDLTRGEVTYMEPSTFEGPLADKEVRLYPASISDEEAVRAARVAAKLLTEAESYYNSTVGLSGFTADLTFSLETDNDGVPYVRMDGTVDGVELTRGAFWHPETVWREDASSDLSMVYPAFTDGVEAHVSAWWTDEERTSVTLSTRMTAMLSSLFNVGYWEFTVELDSGAVARMEGLSFRDGLPDGETRFYPESISEEEALRAARIAAKLLTAGEDYYNNHKSASEDLYAAMPELYADVFRGTAKFVLYKNEPPISIAEVPALICPGDEYMCFQRYAVVDLLGGQGSNETPQVLVYVGGVAGDMAGYLLLWEEDGQVHGEIFDSYGWRNRWFIDLKTDGTFMCTDSLGGHDWMSISHLWLTAAGGCSLYSDVVWRGLDASGQKIDLESFMVIDQELDEAGFEQAMEAQRAKPDVTWHKLPLKDLDDVPAQPAFPVIDPGAYTFTMDEYGLSVSIDGLDCQYARWSASRTDHNNGGMKGPSLSISKPRFLGDAFADVYSSVEAEFQDGQLRMQLIEELGNSPGSLGSRDFLVDLTTGAVTEQEISIPEWKAKLPAPSDKVLADAALTLAQLSQAASDFYQASLPTPEEGPLPFDVPMKLMFCSGAGAWDTLLTLHPDGSFEGDYHDADMTIEYVCLFHGRFGDIRQVTDASWSLTLEELTLDTKYPVGAEWDEGVIHYISSTPYGFDKKGGEGPLEPGAQFMFYTPEAKGYRPNDELYGMYMSNPDTESIMYQFCGWMPSTRKIGAWGPDTRLGYYGLCNMATGQGFFDLNAWGIA